MSRGCGGTGRFPRAKGILREGREKQRARRQPGERRGGPAEALLGERPPREAAAALAHEAYETDRTIRELCLEKGILPKEKLDELLDARKMTGR